MSELRRGRVQVAGVASPTLEAGRPDAREAVVFVHGNPGSASDFSELLKATGEFARALALDMPGFGHADKPAGFDYTVSGYAAHLQGAVAELGVERAHLVLHDFGGPFGLMWGLQQPDAWASVALINVGVMPGYRWHAMARRWRTPVLGELVQAWIPRWAWRRTMQASSPRGLPPAFVDKMYDEYDRATRRAVLRLYRATPDPGETALALGAEIAALHKPAIVIWGAQDPFIGVEFAERQREFFDVRELCILDDSGHWPFQDNPEAVREALVPFLERQLQPQPA